jgi:glycosyltransferase involved in cell wall biosynthesis
VRPIRVLELRSVRGTGGGPEKTILLGAARTDPHKFAVTVCYIRDARDTVFGIDSWAAALPIDYVELIERHSFDPSIWPALRRLIRERKIDIVHSHDYKTNVLAWLLGKFEPVIPLSTVHGWTGHSMRERIAYYPLDKRVLGRFPTAIAVSDDIRGELLRHGARPHAVRTVLNGIDHLAFARDADRVPMVRAALGLGVDDIVVGAVGRLEPQKRFDLLIDVVHTLRSSHPRLVLVIAGDGSLRSALQAQIDRLQLGSVCRLLGHRSDVAELHHAFDLLVQASDYEGTPNAVLEAMALETPVVATDVGGTSQLIRDGIEGLIVPPADTHALTRAMDLALTDRMASAERARAARRRVETDLSFEARMAAVEAIYVELCRRGGHTATGAAVMPLET